MEMVSRFDFESMADDVIRSPCSASVACAVFFSRRLRRIVSDSHFLNLFRQRHPSSPLLGIFASFDKGRLPLFENISSGTILDGMVCRADTGLAYLDKKKDWHLEDCRNGRLLLCSNENSFCIYDPLSQRRVDCGSRPYGDEGEYLSNCLLEGLSCRIVSVQQRGKSTKALESFRFISLQRRRRRSCQPEVRAVEYDSGTLEWRSHPWNELQSLGETGGAMHAADHIFWEFNEAFLLVLDTDTMRFSLESLLPQLADKSLAIGELQDNKACAVCLQGTDTIPDICIIDPQPHLKVRLQVWAIEKKKGEEKEEEGKSRFESFDWEMKEEVLVSDILDKDARVYVVTKVISGLVVIGHRFNKDYYVINLHCKTQVAKFSKRGRDMPYLYQLPWPPSVLAGATIMSSIYNKHIVGDEVSKQCPSNNKDGPAATTEERHISGDEVSKQCPSNKDVPATTEERYPLTAGSFNDITLSMDQLNLGENSPEATVSSALVANSGEMMDRQKSLQDGYPLNMSEQNGVLCQVNFALEGVFCELDEQRPHPHSGGQRTRLLGDVYATKVTTSTAHDGPAQMGKRPRKKSTRYSEEDYICTQTRERCKKL